MRWTRGPRSKNIEDRRGEPATPRRVPIGLGRGIGRRGGVRLGLGGTVLVLGLVLLFQSGILGNRKRAVSRPSTAEEEVLADFVSFVLDDVQGMWARELPRQTGKRYQDAKLVLFTDSVRSGCGYAEAAMGPFYCPRDQKAYIDLGFYHALKSRYGAPGDFAQAYVIAHEIGHHLQNHLDISDRIGVKDRKGAESGGVRLELQADCFAGIWAFHTQQKKVLESGDIEEGLTAAAAIGDDRLQRRAGARVNPEKWTHGSSVQRVSWFKRGLAHGRFADCDTFSVDGL